MGEKEEGLWLRGTDEFERVAGTNLAHHLVSLMAHWYPPYAHHNLRFPLWPAK